MDDKTSTQHDFYFTNYIPAPSMKVSKTAFC